MRSGRTLRSAVDRSFGTAWSTILKADGASLLGAALLYWLAVGPVRGFAFFLGLSTVLDLIVAWYFMRPVVTLLSRAGLHRHAVLGVARRLAVASDGVGTPTSSPPSGRDGSRTMSAAARQARPPRSSRKSTRTRQRSPTGAAASRWHAGRRVHRTRVAMTRAETRLTTMASAIVRLYRRREQLQLRRIWHWTVCAYRRRPGLVIAGPSAQPGRAVLRGPQPRHRLRGRRVVAGEGPDATVEQTPRRAATAGPRRGQDPDHRATRSSRSVQAAAESAQPRRR